MASKKKKKFRRTRKSRGPLTAPTTRPALELDIETPPSSKRRPSRGQGGSSGLAKLPCFDFNANKCHFAQCRYGHSCSNCDGSLPAEDCRRTKEKEGQGKGPAAINEVPKLARRQGSGGSDRH